MRLADVSSQTHALCTWSMWLFVRVLRDRDSDSVMVSWIVCRMRPRSASSVSPRVREVAVGGCLEDSPKCVSCYRAYRAIVLSCSIDTDSDTGDSDSILRPRRGRRVYYARHMARHQGIAYATVVHVHLECTSDVASSEVERGHVRVCYFIVPGHCTRYIVHLY